MPNQAELAANLLRRHMSELGRKGGAATREKAKNDPSFYPSIGRAGGRAAAQALRAKFEREAALIESPTHASPQTTPEPKESDDALLASTFAPPQAAISPEPETVPARSGSLGKADVLAFLDTLTTKQTR